MITKKAGLRYVARGDAAAYDFDQTTLTQDGAWHTLDLSAIIPANAKLVHLRLGAAASASGRYLRVSPVGYTLNFAIANVATQVANIINEMDAIVPCSGQQVQYWTTGSAFASLRFVVLGWFL